MTKPKSSMKRPHRQREGECKGDAATPASSSRYHHRRRRRRRRRQQQQRPLLLLATATTAIYLSTTSHHHHHHHHPPQHHFHFLLFVNADCNPCETVNSGFVQIPKTNCGEFAQCNNNVVSQRFSCQNGLIYDATLKQCNWATSASCGPDPDCPTPEPTVSPTKFVAPTASPTTYEPTKEDYGFVTPTADADSSSSSSSLGSGGSSGSSSSGSSSSSTSGGGPSYSGGGGIPIILSPTPPNAGMQVVPVPAPAPALSNNNNIVGAPPTSGLEPIRYPHHVAVWAHLNANKIGISNHLLRVARKRHNLQGGGSTVDVDELRNYAYHDFFHSLRSMAEEGYAAPMPQQQQQQQQQLREGGSENATGEANDPLSRKVFYLGDPSITDDAAAAGLINVAIFLSQAMADSISAGSCDEINTELNDDGNLPVSNSCGQYGRSYQDMRCAEEESFMECGVDAGMEVVANPNGRSSVSPMYCGSTARYPFTASAEYIAGREPMGDVPVANWNGRTDVEGCCWWGRGTLNTKGICQYGKLNYYLGARAHQEGRPSRYPAIDFCATPQQICSAQRQDAEIEWISGLFRWIDTVQSYNSPQTGWNYIAKLHEFVAGGMVDGLFIHGVSSIVTQGCHSAPCSSSSSSSGTGTMMTDGAERWSYFLQVIEAFGLPVNAQQG